jgi:hypothetical protein
MILLVVLFDSNIRKEAAAKGSKTGEICTEDHVQAHGALLFNRSAP